LNRISRAGVGTTPNALLHGLGMRRLFNSTNTSGATSDEFAPPFLVTAAAISDDEVWINALWNYSRLAVHQDDWFPDYFKLICMITASGNYWKPEAMN